MKKLNNVDLVTDFVKKYRNPNNTMEPGEKFLRNLDSIKEFEETDCGKACSKGFIVKNDNGTFFTDRIPKSSCEDYLTMQLVSESFTASKRDYTEVSKGLKDKPAFLKIFADKEQFKEFVDLINPDEERSGMIFDPVQVLLFLQVSRKR